MHYVYLADQFVPGGDIISEILHLSLNDLETKGELLNDNPVLYFQVDNCGENKNRTMYRSGAPWHFEKLKAGFLMVGRTSIYEDNDQLFSTISFHFKTYKTCCAGPLP